MNAVHIVIEAGKLFFSREANVMSLVFFVMSGDTSRTFRAGQELQEVDLCWHSWALPFMPFPMVRAKTRKALLKCSHI